MNNSDDLSLKDSELGSLEPLLPVEWKDEYTNMQNREYLWDNPSEKVFTVINNGTNTAIGTYALDRDDTKLEPQILELRSEL